MTPYSHNRSALISWNNRRDIPDNYITVIRWGELNMTMIHNKPTPFKYILGENFVEETAKNFTLPMVCKCKTIFPILYLETASKCLYGKFKP